MKRLTYIAGASLIAAGALLTSVPAAAAADIYGSVTFSGKAPPEIVITPLRKDPTCGPMHKETPTTHFYKVGAHGEFGDVVVSLAGVHGKSSGPTAKPLLIDQKGCEYTPYVSACQTGQRIIIRNSDPVLHNVHATPRNSGNKEQNLPQLPHGPDVTLVFNAPENFLRIKCDVHLWMFAYVSVFDHPWFSVTGEDGKYRIHNVPPGQYTLVARHRKAGTIERKVDVKDQDVKVDFKFQSHGDT